MKLYLAELTREPLQNPAILLIGKAIRAELAEKCRFYLANNSSRGVSVNIPCFNVLYKGP